MRLLKFTLIYIFIINSVACSGITSKPIGLDVDDLNSNGFRYYESSPYILVYSDGKSLNSELIYLPDLTRKRSVELFEFLSSNATTLNFTNGVLTTSTNEGNSTALPKAIIDSAKKVAISAAKAGAFSVVEGENTTRSVPPPILFKLVVKGTKTKLIQSSAVTGEEKPKPVVEIIVNN